MDKDTTTAIMAVLEFYADRDNYTPIYDHDKDVHCPNGRVAYDEGERARDALKLIKR